MTERHEYLDAEGKFSFALPAMGEVVILHTPEGFDFGKMLLEAAERKNDESTETTLTGVFPGMPYQGIIEAKLAIPFAELPIRIQKDLVWEQYKWEIKQQEKK